MVRTLQCVPQNLCKLDFNRERTQIQYNILERISRKHLCSTFIYMIFVLWMQSNCMQITQLQFRLKMDHIVDVYFFESFRLLLVLEIV